MFHRKDSPHNSHGKMRHTSTVAISSKIEFSSATAHRFIDDQSTVHQLTDKFGLLSFNSSKLVLLRLLHQAAGKHALAATGAKPASIFQGPTTMDARTQNILCDASRNPIAKEKVYCRTWLP